MFTLTKSDDEDSRNAYDGPTLAGPLRGAHDSSILTSPLPTSSLPARSGVPVVGAPRRGALRALADVLFLNMWTEPVRARSRTADSFDVFDFGMFAPVTRAFVVLAVCPFLCYPVAVTSLYGFCRCAATLRRPSYLMEDQYESSVNYGVQKRVYHDRTKRLVESQVITVKEMQHALEVTQGVRNAFVDDPTTPHVAYYVVEQKILRRTAFFSGQYWSFSVLSDVMRYLAPLGMAMVFKPSCRRLAVDMQLWWRGRLKLSQLRHPILNFSKTYDEYNRSLYRINVTKPAPRGAQAWSKNM